MQAVKERAAVGSEVGREEGKGVGGRAVEALENVVTGKDGPHHHGDHVHSGAGHADGGHDLHGGLMNLANRSVVTGQGEEYCPNPNDTHLPKEFETRVQIIQRYPEMRTIEETFFVKEIRNEDRIVTVPKTRVLMEEHQRIDIVPVIKQVPKTRIEIVHRVIQEEREVTEMVPVVEMVEVPRTEVIPRVVTEDHEEKVSVPVVIEVPRVRKVEVPTGNFCEAPAGEYINPGHFNLLGKKGHGLLKRTTSSSSSSSSDDEKRGRHKTHGGGVLGALGVGGGAAKARTHKKSSSSSSSDNENKVNKGHKSHGLGALGLGPVGTGPAGATHTNTHNADSSSSSSPDSRQPANLHGNSAPSTPSGRTSKKKPSLFQRIEAKLIS